MVLSPATIGSPNTLVTWARVERLSCNDCNKVKLLIRTPFPSSAGVPPAVRRASCPPLRGRDALATAGKMPALHIHHSSIHAVEGVYPRLLLDAVTPPLVTSRVQISLHGLANPHIFDLNLVAELHRSFGRRTAQIFLRQIPLEYRPRPVGRNRQHDVQRNIIGIAV